MQIVICPTPFYFRYVIGCKEYISMIKQEEITNIHHLTKDKAKTTREFQENLIDIIANNFTPGDYFITLMLDNPASNNKELHREALKFALYLKHHLKGNTKKVLYSEEISKNGRQHIHYFVSTNNVDMLKNTLEKWGHGKYHYTRINNTNELIKTARYIPKAICAEDNKHFFIGLHTVGLFRYPRYKYINTTDESSTISSLIPENAKVFKDYWGVEPYTNSEFREVVALSEK